MTNGNRRRPARARLLACCALLSGLAAFPAGAETWVGGGGTFFWTTPANWVGGVVPPSSFATFLTFGPASTTGSIADAPWQVNRIDLADPPQGISGATLSFGGAAPALNASGGPHFLNNALDLQADLTITNDLDFTLGGGPSGTGGLTKAGPGTLMIDNAFTMYSGATSIQAGTLRLTGDTVPGPVVVASGATFETRATAATLTLLSGLSGGGSLHVSRNALASGGPPFTHTGGTLVDFAILNATLTGGGTLVNNLGQVTTGDSVFSSIAGDGQLILNGTTIVVGSDNTSTTYSGSVTGPSGLTKVGTGRLTITAGTPFATLYNGTTTVSGGILRIGDGINGPGSINGAIVNDARLELDCPTGSFIQVNNTLSGAGPLDVLAGSFNFLDSYGFTGPIGISAGAQLVASFANGGPLTVDGYIGVPNPSSFKSVSGAGGFDFGVVTVGADNTSTAFTGPINGNFLTKVGSGILTLAGAAINVNTTTINGGTLRYGNGVTGPATLNPFLVNTAVEFDTPGAGTTIACCGNITGAGTLRVLGGSLAAVPGVNLNHSGVTQVDAGAVLTARLQGFSPVVIAAGGRFNSDGSSISQLSGAGEMNLVNFGTLYSDFADSTFSGSLLGPMELGKAGPATLTLSGASTNAGGVNVGQGTLVLTGSLTGPVQVYTGATLKGTGTIGGTVTVDAGGTIAPGLSPGQINTGNLVLAGTAQFEILGPTPGTQYDNINVTGTVTLTGSTLQLIGSYVPVPGDVFRLIANDGLDAVTGTFNGLPEGSTITFNGVPLRLQYAGGTGNDVVLSAAPTGFYDWSGTGGNALWSTNANWVGTVAPPSLNTTAVRFGAAGTTFAPSVDAPWTVNRIDMAAAAYTLSGSAITLAGTAPQINVTGAAQAIAAPIVLGATSTITNATALSLQGAISGAGGLVKAGAGALTLAGTHTYGGGTTVSAGTLLVTGTMTGPVTVGSGGTVGGTGTIGGSVDVNAGATLAPGIGAGALNTGNLALAGVAQFDILGTTPGTQHDTVNVTGTVTLTGATLQLAGAYVPVAGNTFTIIANDGADAVTGTFAGLAEGASVTFNGVSLRITYAGGSGNDVVLTATPGGAYDWSGTGGNAAWSNAPNWTAGLAPPSANTTAVSFGAAGTTFAPSVDAPWTVNRIDMTSRAYTISGSAITFAGAAPRLNASGATQAIAAPLVLGAATAVDNAGPLALQGAISGGAGLVKAGAGALTLSGASTFGGGITVNAGTLLVTGTVPGPVTVNMGATLGGTGTIAGAVGVNAGGFLAPGLSPGQVNTGNLALAGTAQFEIQGTAPGTQYDTINVTGTVTLTGATLQLLGAYTPVMGDSFTLIANDAADPVTGTFAGLAEGGTTTFNGVLLRITYVGGTGNDVVLTAVPGALPPQVIPTMSPGALAALVLLLMAMGGWALRTQRRAGA